MLSYRVLHAELSDASVRSHIYYPSGVSEGKSEEILLFIKTGKQRGDTQL